MPARQRSPVRHRHPARPAPARRIQVTALTPDHRPLPAARLERPLPRPQSAPPWPFADEEELPAAPSTANPSEATADPSPSTPAPASPSPSSPEGGATADGSTAAGPETTEAEAPDVAAPAVAEAAPAVAEEPDAATRTWWWLRDLFGAGPESPEELMSRKASVKDFEPSTGLGMFDATYDAAGGVLTITSRIFFRFKDGDPAHPSWQAALNKNPALDSGPEGYQWTDAERASWRAAAIASIQQEWSSASTGLQLHCTRPGFERLPPVAVKVRVLESGDADAHFRMEVNQYPNDTRHLVDKVDPWHGDRPTTHMYERAHDGVAAPDRDTHALNPETEPKYKDFYKDLLDARPAPVVFDPHSSAPRAPDVQALETFGRILGKPGQMACPLSADGHSEAGEDPELAMDRIFSVGRILNAAGAKQPVSGHPHPGEPPGPAARTVTLAFAGGGPSQTTLLHEFGHMMGLWDEYAQGRRTPGTEARHSALAQELLGTEPVVAGQDDRIMSVGGEIEPHHYLTFVEALGEMTDLRGEWSVTKVKAPVAP